MFDHDDWEPTMGRRGEHVEGCDARPGVLGFGGETGGAKLEPGELAAIPQVSDDAARAAIDADVWIDPMWQAEFDRVATAIRAARLDAARRRGSWRDGECRRRS